jgi:L-lactate dehydrogenase complex protein LldG
VAEAHAVSAREAILAALGGMPSAAPALPPVYAPPRGDPDDLEARFAASLEAAGGRVRTLTGPDALVDALRSDPVASRARRLWSSVPEILSRHPDGPPRTPRDLADLDFALLPGVLGVAESGAVWVAPRDSLERAACFLAEHVALVVPRAALVPDLHAAYARVDVAASPFGCFVCGPSKTADIEQALVIGAHGPRSILVALLGGVVGQNTP